MEIILWHVFAVGYPWLMFRKKIACLTNKPYFPLINQIIFDHLSLMRRNLDLCVLMINNCYSNPIFNSVFWCSCSPRIWNQISLTTRSAPTLQSSNVHLKSQNLPHHIGLITVLAPSNPALIRFPVWPCRPWLLILSQLEAGYFWLLILSQLEAGEFWYWIVSNTQCMELKALSLGKNVNISRVTVLIFTGCKQLHTYICTMYMIPWCFSPFRHEIDSQNR